MDASIIIPTFNHGETLRFALHSIKQQSVQDFEVFVIGDGVPEQHKSWVRNAVAADSRFIFIDHPKHERRGEPYRHEVLKTATGKLVCYMTDRDIWLPNHLEQMQVLLANSDYAHALPLHVLPDASLRVFACDLTGPGYRYMMSTVMDNRMPFSSFAHTR
ncbi:MAG: glycosyltransferase family 2 protein, partial [Pseudomonadota bacterium]